MTRKLTSEEKAANRAIKAQKVEQATVARVSARKSKAPSVPPTPVSSKVGESVTSRNVARSLEAKTNPLGAAFGCALPSAAGDTIMRNLDYSPAQMTDIEKSYGQLFADLESSEAATKLTAAQDMADNRRLMYDHSVRMGETSKAGVLSSDMGRGLESWLAAKMGIVHRQFGLGSEYTDAGWARQSMYQARRDGAGFMNKTLREQRLAEQVADNTRKLRRIFKENGIRDRATRAYIATTAVEYGAVPYLQNMGGLGRVARMLLDGKVKAFRDGLLEMGIPARQVDEILAMGNDVNKVYNQTALIAREAGIAVGDATRDGIGYVPRILSAEAQKRINWRHADLAAGTVEWIDGSSESVGSILTRTRKTFDTTVENEVLLDYVIRTQSNKAYGNPLAIYEKIVGEGALLGDVLDDHRYMNTLLANELGEGTIAALVDNGILGRIPMNSDEVRKFVTSKFNMPFKGLDELMATDWDRGYKTYTKQLEGLAQESNYIGQIVSNVTSGKWGVSGDAVRANPDQYRGFVPLMGTADAPGAFSQAQMNKFFVDENTRKAIPLGNTVADSFVHPIAADLMQAIAAATVDPITLGVFGNVLQTTGRIWRGMALATVEFFPRQMLASVFMTFAGGGNLMTLPEIASRVSMYQTLTLGDMLPQRAAEMAFDNTRRIYTSEKLTMLEMWNRAKDSGYISDYDPQSGMSVGGTVAAAAPGLPDIRRSLRYAQNVLNVGGAGRLIGEMGGVLDRSVQTMLIPVMAGNVAADTIGRFNGLLSTTKKYGDTDPWHNPLHVVEDGVYGAGHLVSGVQKYHGTFDDAVKHWTDYFYLYDDATALNNTLNKYVTPFWSFASKNIPATFRHVVQHPSRYAAFARIYAMMNSDAVQSQDLNEGNIPSWMMNAQPVFIKMKRQDGTDAWMAMPLASVDPYTSVLDDAKGLAKEVLKAFGLWDEHTRPGTTGEILDDAPWSENKSNYLQDAVLSKLYPHWRSMMSAAANRDLTVDYRPPLDGRENKINTFLGYEMSQRTEMMLRTALPILSTLNRMNPFDRFGRADYTNPYTGAVRRGIPSQMPGSGGVPRSDRDAANNVGEFPDLALNNVLGSAGVKLYPVDEATNTGSTLIQIQASLKEGKSWLQKGYRELAKMDEGTPAYIRQKTYLDNAAQFFYQLAADQKRLQVYAQSKGMTPDRALTALQSQGRKVGDLPLSPEESLGIAEDLLK